MRHLTVPSRVILGMLLVFLVSCGTAHDADEKYYLISANIKIPYWQAGSSRFISGSHATQGAFGVRGSRHLRSQG